MATIRPWAARLATPVLLMLAFACGAAHAADGASATARLGNFTFTLVDLDTSDGIDAGFSFPDPTQRSFLRTLGTSIAATTPPEVAVDEDNNGVDASPGLFSGSLASATQVPGVSSFANIGSGALNVGGQASATDYGFFFARASDQTLTGGSLAMRLTPHTSLLFAADASVSGQLVDVCSALACSSAEATAELGASFRTDGGLLAQLDGSNARVSLRLTADGGSGAHMEDAATRALRFVITNPTDEFMLGWLRADVLASGESAGFLSPVPEPSAVTLMLAGLAIVVAGRARTRT